MKNELYKHKRSDKVKWTLTAVMFVLFAVLMAGVFLQVFAKSDKLKPSEWFKKTDKPQAEQTSPETDNNTKTFTREAKMAEAENANSEPFLPLSFTDVPFLGNSHSHNLISNFPNIVIKNNVNDTPISSDLISLAYDHPSESRYVHQLILPRYPIIDGYLFDGTITISYSYLGSYEKLITQEDFRTATDTFIFIGNLFSSSHTVTVFSLTSGFFNMSPNIFALTFYGDYYADFFLNRGFTVTYNYIPLSSVPNTGSLSDCENVWNTGIDIDSTMYWSLSDRFYVASNISADAINTILKVKVNFLSYSSSTKLVFPFMLDKKDIPFGSDEYVLTTLRANGSGVFLYEKEEVCYGYFVPRVSSLCPSPNDVTFPSCVVKCSYEQIPILPLPETPEKEGYNFIGWYYGTEDEHGENCEPYDGAPIYENTNLHAHFEVIMLPVSFLTNGGTDVENIEVAWGSCVTLPATEKLGYNFLGWYLPDGTQYANQPVTNNITLTAKWEIKTFKVTFYVNGEKYAEKTVEWGSRFEQISTAATAQNLQIMSVRASSGTLVKKLSDITVTEDYDVQAEFLTGVDKVKNTVKNNWLTIALSAGGIIVLMCFVSALCSRKKKHYRR